MENLVAFKKVYAAAIDEVSRCLERFFPAMTARDIRTFIYAFFPFLFGVYPYAAPTEKQREAMALAHVDYARYSIYEVVRAFLLNMLRSAPGISASE